MVVKASGQSELGTWSGFAHPMSQKAFSIYIQSAEWIRNHASYCSRSPTANIFKPQTEPKAAARFENFQKIAERRIRRVSRLGHGLARFRPGYYKDGSLQ